jgi:hypothetical protein
VSPYNQTISKGVFKRKDKSKGAILSSNVNKNVAMSKSVGALPMRPPETTAATVTAHVAKRHQTVDELMKRIVGKQTTSTLKVSEERLTKVEVVSGKEQKKRKKHHSSSLFLTEHDDDLSVNSDGGDSLGSLGSFGSYSSLKSAITVHEEQVSKGSQKIKTFEVDVSTKDGALIRQRRTLKSLIDDIKSCARDNELPPVFVPHMDEMPDTMISWNGKNNLKPSKKMLAKMKRDEERAQNKRNAKRNSSLVANDDGMSTTNGSVKSYYHSNGFDDDDDDLGSLGNDSATLSVSGIKKKHVDIIGMYQTVPLILARADERCRKREKAVAVKHDVTEEKKRALMEIIKFKMTRPERYAEALRKKQLCIAWLKLVPAIIFSTTYAKVCPPLCHIQARNKERFWAIMVLTKTIRKFLRNKLDAKIKQDFMGKIQRSFWVLNMAIRAKRRKFAVRKIRYFFTLFAGKNRIKYIIHRFVQSAHCMQRHVRNFVACTRGRLETLHNVWDELEVEYIYSVLEKRTKQQNNLLGDLDSNKKKKNKKGEEVAEDDESIFKIDPKLKIEMAKQADRWEESQAKMDALLQKHRKAGLIGKVDLRESAQKLVLNNQEKKDIISDYLRRRRRQYILDRDETAKRIMRESQTFAVDDATDLLQGRTEKINDTVRVRMQMIRRYGSTNTMMPLFDEHGDNSLKAVQAFFKKNIERLHKKEGTFLVKKRSEQSMKARRKPQMK